MGFLGFQSVSQTERLIVFNLSGRFAGVKGPGLVFVVRWYPKTRQLAKRESSS